MPMSFGGGPRPLNTMFSPGNQAQTAQSGNPINPGPESQTNNPYPQGISIPGTGANNSATTFQDFWDPNINMWAIHQGADGAIAPIYTGQQWNTGSIAIPGLGSNERFNGGNIDIANKGGGSTEVGYHLDPKTGYAIPTSSQGIGQKSWWQSTGIPIAETIAGAAAAGPLAGALGGGLLGGAAAGGIIGGAEAGLQGRSVGSGILSGAIGGGVGYGAGQLGGSLGLSGSGLGAFSGGVSGAVGAGIRGGNIAQGALTGAAGGGLSSGINNAVGGGGWGAAAGAAGASLAAPQLGSLFGGNSGSSSGGGSMPGSTLDPNAASSYGTDTASLSNPFGSGSNVLGSLASLYGTYTGNQANQTTGANLMGMYNNAGALAAPSVNTTNNLIQNPNSYFSSPLYQAQASLYGNNVNAAKNAAGTAGNGIDYTQKMMGFAGQNYDNYLNTVGGQAQGFLGNQAKYGLDYAYGTSLQNQSSAATNAKYGGALANFLGGSGGNSLLTALGKGASSGLGYLTGSGTNVDYLGGGGNGPGANTATNQMDPNLAYQLGLGPDPNAGSNYGGYYDNSSTGDYVG